MPSERYGMLIMPSANRVYAESSVQLMAAELRVFDGAVLSGRVGEVAREQIGAVPYLVFEAEDLSERDVRFLANLSSVYALFRLRPDGALAPIELDRLDRLDDDLISIQKYSGKTNEYFTKMLLNVTVLASDRAGAMLDRALKVFDPLCGRGTTLNQALVYGWDAAGMDVDGKDYEAYASFIRTYLQRKRIKHTADEGPVRRNQKHIGRRLTAEFGLNREDYKAGDKRHLTVVNADTLTAADFFPAASFDAIVTDAPYGVQHGSHAKAGGLRRSPLQLLEAALPVWSHVLRPGGTVGVAWNTNVADREATTALFAEAGLEVRQDEPYLSFRHRVDQAIMRDIIVARKPKA